MCRGSCKSHHRRDWAAPWPTCFTPGRMGGGRGSGKYDGEPFEVKMPRLVAELRLSKWRSRRSWKQAIRAEPEGAGLWRVSGRSNSRWIWGRVIRADIH